MFQTLSIVLAKLKAGNTSENVINEIRQIIYSLHQTKEITTKRNGYYVYNPHSLLLWG